MALSNLTGSTGYAFAGGGGASITTIAVAASPYNVTTSDVNGSLLAVDTDGGPITVNLEVAPAQNRYLIFKNVGTSGNLLTIGRNGNNIDGIAADITLIDQASVSLVYDATQAWMVI